MATVPTPQPDPPKNQVIIEIERLGFKWTEVAQYDLSQLSPDRRVQVRESKNYAPKEIVDQYAVQMGQSKFPPIVVTSDGWLLDGNTRVGGCVKRGDKFFPAYVLDIALNGPRTTDKLRYELHALASTLNSLGAQRLTAKEVRNNARMYISLGWRADQIARAIGLQPSSLTLIRKEIDAEKKLIQVGLDAETSLKGASLRALGAPNALNLNDAPYKALAELAADAGLNAKEISDSATKVREKGSDSEQVRELAGIRTELAERIRVKALTGTGKPPTSRILRQRLGFVTKFAGKEADLLETDPNVYGMHIEALQITIAVLTEVLALQPSS